MRSSALDDDINAPPDVLAHATGAALTLAERLGPVKVLFLAGLALDFCVLDSALTARAKGYQEVYMISASGRP